ncbi:hypothetical protein CW304_26940 [Bacillus sp. UFRGS-B20]|nr:hypothetical protein CW304_26940 [Bacillus sp. UFRGS-B20]
MVCEIFAPCCVVSTFVLLQTNLSLIIQAVRLIDTEWPVCNLLQVKKCLTSPFGRKIIFCFVFDQPKLLQYILYTKESRFHSCFKVPLFCTILG